MNGLDLVLVALLAVPAFMGFRTGLIRMVAGLGGIVVGIVLAGQFGGALAGFLGDVIDNETTAGVLGFALIVAVTVAAGVALGAFARQALSFVFLGWVDRTAGVALGLLIGAIFASVIVFIVDYVPVEDAENIIAGSLLAGFFLNVVFPLANVLPGNLEDLAEAAA